MNPHLESITDEQRQVIGQLGPFATMKGIYLAGGTAAALYLGHRKSVDLDWFSPEPISDPMRVAEDIRSNGIPLELSSTERGTIHGSIHGVRVSLIELHYPLLNPVEVLPGLDCQIASLPDLAAMKLVAVSQRGSRKDFIDLYALGTSGLSLADMLAAFRQRYSISDVSRVLYSLVYFEDAEAEPMPVMLWEVNWQEIKRTIRGWVQAVGD